MKTIMLASKLNSPATSFRLVGINPYYRSSLSSMSVPNCHPALDSASTSQLFAHLAPVQHASKLFDEMPHPNCFVPTTRGPLGLAHNRVLLQSGIPFSTMTVSTFSAATICGIVKAGNIHKARQVFDSMVHRDRDVFSWTSLVSGYFKIGDVDEALALFHLMPDKNVVSWTVAVSGCAQNGLVDQARQLFDLMPHRNVVSWTVMLKSYVDVDQIDEAYQLFNSMPQRNPYSWNIMLSGFLLANRLDEAIRLFDSMPQKNEISWTTMVTGLARRGLTAQAREYFDAMPKRDVPAWNAMITAYAERGIMAEASKLFNSMPRKNLVSWNAMLDGYARNGSHGQALHHLTLMLQSNFNPNESSLTSILTSCDSMSELIQTHALIVLRGFEHDVFLGNALVTAYSRCGDLQSARFAFDQIEFKDIVSQTAMILAYSNHGYAHHALQVFAHLLRSGSKPDKIAFVGVLSACSRVGLVQKGQQLFDSMSRVYGVEPSAEHYSCLVDILGRAGQVNKAMEVVSKIPQHELDGAVVGALLGACRLHGDVVVATQMADELKKLELTNSGCYVLLANIYAAGGKLSEFAQVRKKMKQSDFKKEPGFSQIEIGGKKHLFSVGDGSHPQVKEIYSFLKEMMLPMIRERNDDIPENIPEMAH